VGKRQDRSQEALSEPPTPPALTPSTTIVYPISAENYPPRKST
jgi:hypothetical protein